MVTCFPKKFDFRLYGNNKTSICHRSGVFSKVPLASKSSFCMKVQTVGHKQNSGSYIAKCVSNWLLKCIIILYYQERPLLKFDQVSVSYSLIEVILFYCLAVKAKTVEEVIKNSPAAGVLDRALAEEYKVIFIAFLSCI